MSSYRLKFEPMPNPKTSRAPASGSRSGSGRSGAATGEPPALQIVSRTLSPTQAATRSRLLAAARDLAIEGGYDAVSIRNVAARAGLSAPTAYQYFSSKDHLLVDLMVDLVGGTTAAIESRPVEGDDPVDRSVSTLRRAVRRMEREPNLYVAMVRAYISGAPEVAHARSVMETSMRAWVDAALGTSEIEDRESVVAILESVLFASMVGLVTGSRVPRDIGDALESAVRMLLKGSPSG